MAMTSPSLTKAAGANVGNVANIPFAATTPLAILAVKRYPPVGASQSIISLAQNTPGKVFNIKPSVSASNLTPPALLIASAMGRVRCTVNRNALIRVPKT